MNYDKQLDFFLKTMEKGDIQVKIFSENDDVKEIDLGLREILGIKENLFDVFKTFLRHLQNNKIYCVTDRFLFTYQILPIKDKKYLLIGPYLSFMPSINKVCEIAEDNGLSSSAMHELEKYYKRFYVISDKSPFHSMIHVLYEYIWDNEVIFQQIDINWEISKDKITDNEVNNDIFNNIKELERRYYLEKKMMQAIINGDIKTAKQINLTKAHIKQRQADPIRNLKNYAIIVNTIFRKSAEYAGVHPVYIDKLSNEFAIRIELISSSEEYDNMLDDMIISYCNMVNNHSLKGYSKLIQHVIIYINSNVSLNLNLKNIANAHGINSSYLSNRFKKETGKTLTEFILQTRMKLAIQLLSATNLQIQTIAQHCGILDVNYFCKLFKKFFNETPNEYRKKLRKLQIENHTDFD